MFLFPGGGGKGEHIFQYIQRTVFSSNGLMKEVKTFRCIFPEIKFVGVLYIYIVAVPAKVRRTQKPF
jgi:hypothetical protein